MHWTHEPIHGEFICDRYTARLPYVGPVWVERWDYNKKLRGYTGWTVICHGLGLKHDILADTPEQAQIEGLGFVRARLVEISEACQ